MAKPSASELQKAAEAVDLDGFDYEVTLETSAGPIRLMLDAANAPGHVRNLVALAENSFYDAGCFHRIIPGFMIQGGCPEGSGRGGPGTKSMQNLMTPRMNLVFSQWRGQVIPTQQAVNFFSA